MQKFLLNLILLYFICCLAFSCGNNDRELEQRIFGNMDSLLEAAPDSAFQFLNSMWETIDSLDKDNLTMRHLMYLASTQNKLYLDLPSYSIFQPVVNYYDQRGNVNDQVMAHYLLGCIFRDKKEPLKALECYQEAIEKADTLSSEFNYVTLFSIYGQIAEIYNDQYLYEKEIEAYKNYSHFALKAGDTLNYIYGIQKNATVYYLLGDSVHYMENAQKSYRLYIENGMQDLSANAYTPIIIENLDRHNYEEAGSLMHKLELTSGFYDADGNISNHREYYYNLKGRYYLGIGETDSAEFCFRKLFTYGYSQEASEGLLKIYQNIGIVDSVLKYSRLVNEQIENLLLENRTKAVSETSGKLELTKYQKKIEKIRLKTKRLKLNIFVYTFILVLCFICVFTYIYRKHKQKKENLLRLQTDFDQLNRQYQDAINEFDSLINSYDSIKKCLNNSQEIICDFEQKLKEKQMEVASLQDKLSKYEFIGLKNKRINEKKAVLESEIGVILKLKTEPSPNSKRKSISQKEWNLFINVCKKHIPDLTNNIILAHKLTQPEILTCLLVYLGFSTNDIAIMFEANNTRISNIKRDVNNKLFHEKTATTLFDNLSERN